MLINVRRLAVSAGGIERRESLSAVRRFCPRKTADVQSVRRRRIDAQLAEIHRPRIAVAHEPPTPTLVIRAIDATLTRIERVWCTPRVRRALVACVDVAVVGFAVSSVATAAATRA